MVRVADSSSLGYGYRELNQQLARENVELRQQLSHLISENARHLEEIHKRDVKIIELERELIDCKPKSQKYDVIRNVVLDNVVAIPDKNSTTRQLEAESHPRTRQSNILPLPEATTINETFSGVSRGGEESIDDNSNPSEDSYSDGDKDSNNNKDEHGENSENEQDVTLDVHLLDRISERSDEDQSPRNNQSETQNDSLDPPDVTSVPPLQPERIIHTPSVFNCLDSIENEDSEDIASSASCLRASNTINASSPIQPIARNTHSNVNNNMFQSTPVQSQRTPTGRIFGLTNMATTEDQENLKGSEIEAQSVTPKLPEKSLATSPIPAKSDEPKKPEPKKAGRPKKQAVKREIGPESAEPTRYNLRKRTKV